MLDLFKSPSKKRHELTITRQCECSEVQDWERERAFVRMGLASLTNPLTRCARIVILSLTCVFFFSDGDLNKSMDMNAL